MSAPSTDIKKLYYLTYVVHWIFGLGIVEFPFGKKVKKFSFWYTLSRAWIYILFAAFIIISKPYNELLEHCVNSVVNFDTLSTKKAYFAKSLVVVVSTFTAWYQVEVGFSNKLKFLFEMRILSEFAVFSHKFA